jgi:hypothetical protein
MLLASPSVATHFTEPTREPLPRKVKMVGLLFCQPSDGLAESDVLPKLSYFHFRSGENINFYCAGYSAYGPPEVRGDERIVARIDDADWRFSEKRFNRFRQEIEVRTRWKYSGDVDLLLTNAKLDPDAKKPFLDFGSTIVCNLLHMRQQGLIASVSSFFESIFRYAEDQASEDPIWGFSDAMGIKKGGDALRKLVLTVLPKNLGKDFERLSNFAVRDISE